MNMIAWREYRCVKRCLVEKESPYTKGLVKYDVANLVDGREVGMLVGSANAGIDAKSVAITGVGVPQVGDAVVLVAMPRAEFRRVNPESLKLKLAPLSGRRFDSLQQTPAEKAIRELMQHVETLGASPHLTRAVVALDTAFMALADHNDGEPVT